MAQDYVERSTPWPAAGSRSTCSSAARSCILPGVRRRAYGGHRRRAYRDRYWYGKHKAASLFGTGPVFGFNANEGLGWIHNGGGKELFEELRPRS